MLKRKVSPMKRPSMMKVASKPSTLSQRNGFIAPRGDASMPKTRFSLNDRSSSSPRLKSFPAEKIKRLDPPPVQNSQENVDMSGPMRNSGQGDSLQQPPVQFYPNFQPVAMPNQNISSISERQVPRSVYPMANQTNQSELAIPCAMENTTMGRPAHRPFVPNVPQANITLRNDSPRKTMSPRLVDPSQNVLQSQTFRRAEPEAQIQQRDPWKIESDTLKPMDPVQEPVIGSYAAFHRRNVEAHGNQGPNVHQQIPIQRSPIDGPNVSNVSPVADAAGWQEPHQIYHRYQPNMVHCCNHNGQTTQTHPGMTSPQDIAVSRIQNYQRNMQNGTYGWSTHPQTSWVQNQRAQIQPYSMNISTPGVNVNQDSAMRYQYVQHGISVPNSRQIITGNYPQQQQQQQQQQQHQQQQQQRQYYYQTQPENTQKQPVVANLQKKDDPKRKSLRFTEPMIRDQEMLVTTMRQQGITEDIMRRQFDALLAEQRKQLLYLEQLERGGDASDSDKLQQRRRVRRKISSIEDDGKPEWMLHITPPRIPYSTIEKMRYEREVNSQQTTPINGNEAVRAAGVNDPQQIYDQPIQANRQQTWQMGGTENWHQEAPHSYVCNNSNVNGQDPGYNVNSGIAGDQGQMRYYGYPVQYQQQHQQYVQQVPENWPSQLPQCNAREEIRTQRYEEPGKKVEPSSLLKLRIYREVVRKQKQNNGLQDPETVKEAMEALKNPANRKGLEYLENLNKKPDRPLSLNGAQDPQENMALENGPRQRYISLNCQQAKTPSANGLENQRNSNNPQPTINLRQRKMENPQYAEYPRQRTSNLSRDCYSLMAERENGTVANSIAKEYHQQQHNAAMQNAIEGFPTHRQSRSENGFQFPGQMQREVERNDRKMMTARSPSMPFAFNEQNRSQFYAAPMHQYYENLNKNSQINSVNAQPTIIDSSGFAGGISVDKNSENLQQHYNCPYKNNDLHEAITIGGIKYLARKPEYIKNQSAPFLQREQITTGKYFNNIIPCQ